jgi:hypothetical protein
MTGSRRDAPSMHQPRHLFGEKEFVRRNTGTLAVVARGNASARPLQLRRTCAALTAACLFPFFTGCYTYTRSVSGSVAPGTDVSLAITDQGRVGLSERMGSGVLRVNGRVVNPGDSSWVVRVSSVEMVAGGKSHWAGEEVQLPRSYVGDVATREFSRKKTWLAVGVTVGALALTISAVSLIGGGFEGSDTPSAPPGQSMRSPLPRVAPAHP